MARNFNSDLTYRASPDAPEQEYDLRVNHPLTIDGTELFLIGHGYAPEITIKDPQGNPVSSGPSVFLPQNASFLSFGVVKTQLTRTEQLGLQGEFFPTYVPGTDGQPLNVFGDDVDPLLSMFVYTGDLGLDGDGSQSITPWTPRGPPR